MKTSSGGLGNKALRFRELEQKGNAKMAYTDESLSFLKGSEMPWALKLSFALRNLVQCVGRFGSWFVVPLILITAFDVTVRKIGWLQLWLVENVSSYFGSTFLQELEWHSHTVLVALVLGFGYISNCHVRVDLIREKLKHRNRAWIEFIGLSVLYIPFACLVTYLAFRYAVDSWTINRDAACAWWQCGEVSPSLVGLSHRWIIKGILGAGLLMALAAGLAIWLEIAVVLFGPSHWRFDVCTVEWPEDETDAVGGKKRLNLDNAVDEFEVRAIKMTGKTPFDD